MITNMQKIIMQKVSPTHISMTPFQMIIHPIRLPAKEVLTMLEDAYLHYFFLP